MKHAAGVTVLLLIMSGTIVSAQSSADTLRARADSLRSVWNVLWKRSDSLRVESMIARMRSDSLKRVIAQLQRRAATPPDTASSLAATPPSADSLIMQELAQQAALRKAHMVVKGGKVASGITVSDSLTRMVMTEECEEGIASYYADQFHGKKTSSGEIYNMHDLTCAHRWLPFGTKVRVTNLRNGRSCVVRVTDRGPWKQERLIDCSKGAAVELDFVRTGTTRVRIEVELPSSNE